MEMPKDGSFAQADPIVKGNILTMSMGHIRETAALGVGGEGVQAFLKFHKDYPDETVVLCNERTGEIKVLRDPVTHEPMFWNNETSTN
jgi:hypothetical protein